MTAPSPRFGLQLDLQRGTPQRMKGIKNLTSVAFRTQGTVGVGVLIPTSISSLQAGGLAPDRSSWISVPALVLPAHRCAQPCFRGKFVAGLRNAFHRGELQFHGSLLPSPNRVLRRWLRVLFRHDWVVYSKRPFGGPEHVLRYLGAYTHRVAISNSRLVALSDGNVTFRWRDSAHGNKKRLMTLDCR